jgi:glycerol-3-phosphate dehydrogenase
VIQTSSSGLVSIMGGKWTIYRKMAEDCVDAAAHVGSLPPKPCPTASMAIHGSTGERTAGTFAQYGSDAAALADLVASEPRFGERLDARLSYVTGQVAWAARCEMARTVEDVLARRMRALFVDANVALAMAPRVAELLATELHRDAAWQAEQVDQFRHVAQTFLPQECK